MAWLCGLVVLLAAALPARAQSVAAIVPRIEILEPRPGQALQGSVRIIGSTNIRNFHYSELAFAYQENPTDTWFLLAESDQGVVREVLAVWDTTTITDNDYQLRLTVLTKDNQTHVYMVERLRVRNYTAVETDTPEPRQRNRVEAETTPEPTQPTFTPSPLPTNPLTLHPRDLTYSALKGAGLVTLFFVVGSLVLALRNRSA
ncbi:MAG: hypothetical protein RML93_04050 [Anaerolineales bacterium]|nr:hypothetical protein [Anaerolineales bacterium]MCS7246653.1 hypothetical protein [Anaerolineales bacterium]MDW8160463.1 hypothetical protein [Anaerolineales bacterium]MDW8446450.1 hypothetical protein [Anaerolineales bacterium]